MSQSFFCKLATKSSLIQSWQTWQKAKMSARVREYKRKRTKINHEH